MHSPFNVGLHADFHWQTPKYSPGPSIVPTRALLCYTFGIAFVANAGGEDLLLGRRIFHPQLGYRL